MKKMQHLFIGLAMAAFITGCATQYEQPRLNAATSQKPQLVPGFYIMETHWWYDKIFCEVFDLGGYFKVNLLSTRGSSFSLKPKKGGKFDIVNSDIGFDRVNRNIKGHGVSKGPNLVEGWATVKIKGLGPIARDQRQGPYLLRPATAPEVNSAKKKKWIK